MSIYRMNGKTKVAELTTQNVDSATILDMVYPVGSIALGVKPNIGTWQKIQGRFLLGSSSSYKVGSTGGEATHKLTVDEMPKHMHRSSAPNNNTSTTTVSNAGAVLNINNAGPMWVTAGTRVNDDLMADSTLNTSNKSSGLWAGGGQSHNNMPPYEVVDIWKRIA